MYSIPMSRPDITATVNGPAVVHASDFSLVTSTKPAAGGEVLVLFATDLSPVQGVGPGQRLPSNPPAPITSPVQVTVDGEPAQVLSVVGYPCVSNAYQVNFQLPSDITRGAAGVAAIQVSAAWSTSVPVNIYVQ